MRLFVKKKGTWIDRHITGILIRHFYIKHRYRFSFGTRGEKEMCRSLYKQVTAPKLLCDNSLVSAR